MDWQAIAVAVLAVLGSAVSGGAVTHYFQARKAQIETEGPANTAEFNRRMLLLFTRVASLESKLEARDAAIDALQDQVRALQSERDDARAEAHQLRLELDKLRDELMG